MSTSRYLWNNLVELKHELHEAQSHIVDLVAPEIREKLLSYHGCETWKEFFEWERSLIEFAIERTVPIPNASQFEERANCPLCGSGGNSRPEGYVFPGGLELHLAERNERPCPVMKAALHLAHDHLRPKLDEEELRAKEVLARRRKIETLYLVNPFEQPSLIDEGWRSCSARDKDGLARAEARLSKLGFNLSICGNVKSYKLEGDGYLVYADPRGEGRISFIVYRKPVPKYRTAAKHRSFFIGDGENLLDSWDKIGRKMTFENKTKRPGRKCGFNEVTIMVYCEKYDSAPATGSLEKESGIKAIHNRHGNVEHKHIRIHPFRLLDGAEPVFRCSDNFKFTFQQVCNSFKHFLVVIS